jgi:hypothetical protein
MSKLTIAILAVSLVAPLAGLAVVEAVASPPPRTAPMVPTVIGAPPRAELPAKVEAAAPAPRAGPVRLARLDEALPTGR